jgi:hypothetical protein
MKEKTMAEPRQELDLAMHVSSEMMSLALDHMLDGAAEVAFEQHISACNQCQAEWSKWQRISLVFGEEPFAGAAPGFPLRFAATLQREQRRKERMLGGLVLVGGTVSIWTIVALSIAGALAAWLAFTPDARWQVTQTFGFGAQLVELLLRNLAPLRDSVVAVLPGPGMFVASLLALLALMAVWARLVLWNREQPTRAASPARDN